MRTTALIVLLAVAASHALAAHSVTVAQLDGQLNTLRTKPDAEAAYLIADLQLTERLDAARLARLQAGFPGEKSRQALLGLADESAFLPPPAAELPSAPAPDLPEQKRIMGLVVGYVAKAIPQLPNFTATRVTARYEDTPLVQRSDGPFIPYEPLHSVGSESTDVVYEGGRETTLQRAKNAVPAGLTTWGVFGPILGTVLLDAAQSKLAFARWEQEPDGVRAVFSYAVSREKSHYEVNFCCVVEQSASIAANTRPFRQTTAYHGEIAVDPATGEIRRLQLEADLKTGEPVLKADILVEYAAVEIGGRSYICPVHSVSRSLGQTVQLNERYRYALANQIQPLKNSLNDVRFTAYHVFRGDMQMLTEAASNSANEPGASTKPATSAEPAQTVDSSVAQAPAGNAQASSPVAPANPNPGQVSANPANIPPAAPPVGKPAIPEMSESADATLPESPLNAQPPAPGVILRTTSRLVEMAVVAFDKKGHPVTDLKPDELQIFDNGHLQKIKFFSHAGEGVIQAGSPPPQDSEPVFTNRPASSSTAVPEDATPSSTILMIDAAHVAFNDLTYARGEMLRFLKTSPAGERVGLYILGGYGFQVLLEPTPDHSRVASALTAWMPRAQDLAHAQDEEQRNRQQFDWVHSVYDLANVNGNGQGGTDPEMYSSGNGVAAAMASPPDARLRAMGDRPEDFALRLLVGVGRHLAAIPGHKTLVWISSDNVLADWSAQNVGREDTGNAFLDGPAIRARETLNEAHVSIYPLDVSQLEEAGVGADIGTRNITPMGKSSRDPGTAAVGDSAPGNRNGRDTARMQEDTHPIQGAFRDLATATGGRALRRAGDIAHELDSIVADGRAAWLLSFAPDTPADGKYHVLTVKTDRPGVSLRFRTGYAYSIEPATMKDRFRDAVWRPQDLNEIGLIALRASDAGPDGKRPAVKLNIAGSDLALAQQGDRWMDKLGVFLVVRDDSGLHSSLTGKQLGLALKPATYQQIMKEGISMEEALPKIPPGDSLRVIVIDENSQRIGTITLGQGIAALQ